MLPEAFIDWWFAPWSYASGIPARLPLAGDALAQRDQYALWCAETGVQADFPIDFDPGWQVAAVRTGSELRKAAELFAGLIAARAQNQSVLELLSIADRRWCMSIAITQPLKACGGVEYLPADPAEVHGLIELAQRLAHGFPGAWTRLRLLLPEPLARRVDGLLAAAQGEPAPSAASAVRAQRCWHMCRVRAVNLAEH